MVQHLKFLDLFSGIGGFRQGMEACGNKCVGWCDIDKFARKSYLAMYPHARSEWNAKDITTVKNSTWRKVNQKYGKINVICGGFPCQSFSIAGKRKGFLDKTRGTLFFQIARAAKEIKPQYLFLENVKGLLNHGHGKTFATILSTLDELGYDAEWHVLNSKFFGVPQNRERVYIIGHLRGSRTAEVFHQSKPIKENSKRLKYYHKSKYSGHDIYKDTGLAPTVSATDYKHPIHVERPLKNKTKNGWEFKQNIFNPKSISSTFRAGGGSGNIPKISYAYNARKHGSYGSTYNILNTKGVCTTLSTMTGGNREPKIAYYHNSKHMNNRVLKKHGVSSSVRAKGHSPKVAIPVLMPDRVHKRQNGRRFKNNQDPMFTLTAEDRDGVALNKKPVEVIGSMQKHASKTNGTYSPTITQAMGTGGGQIPMPVFKVKEATKKGYAKAYPGDSINMSYPNSKTRRGRVGHKIVNTLTASNTNGTQESVLLNNLRVRKLTPRECWRLQGFPDSSFDKAKRVNSNSQLYKQAGNAVSVPVIMYIAKRLYVY